MYSLAEHPEIQADCQREVDELFDGRQTDDVLWWARKMDGWISYISVLFSSHDSVLEAWKTSTHSAWSAQEFLLCVPYNCALLSSSVYRLVGLVVKAYASRAGGPGFESR